MLAITTVVGLSAAAPAGAAEQSFTLDMVDGGGQLKIASADEPFAVESPTSFSGTIDDATGVISGVSFSTPDIAFEQEGPGGVPVDLIAKLTLLAPATGVADGLGNVTIDASVRLDLNVNVAGGGLVTDCVSQPINLHLVASTPYDPVSGRVTLADPNFTIPALQDDGICNSLVIDAVNEQLAGPGNSFTITIEGDLALPPPPGDPSETTLTSDVNTTALGFPVTFTATVEPDDVTGTVFFFNGTTQIGQATLDDDTTAVFTTSGLPVGTHQITARYAGNIDYEGSTSTPITHTVTAVPAITTNLPGSIVVGAAPTEFTATIINPSSGEMLSNLRVDMVFGPLGDLGAANLVVEWDRDGTWEELPTTGTTTTRTALFDSPTGFSLGAGESRVVDFRISAAAATGQGLLPVSFTLVDVDGESGDIAADYGAVTGEIWIVGAERRPTNTVITNLQTEAGDIMPRVGDGLYFWGNINRGGPAPLPSVAGVVELYANGVLLGVSPVGVAGDFGLNLAPGPDSPLNDLTPGTNQVTARFLGDNLYQGSASPPFTVTLAPWVGERYTCALDLVLLAQTRTARVDVNAITPAAALPGTTVPLSQLEVTTWTTGSPGLFSAPGMPALQNQELRFTGGATGTFTGFALSSQPFGQFEGYSHMTGGTASVEIEGEPGDVIDITFDGFTGGAPFLPGVDMTTLCSANDVGEHVASITVAGTVLEVGAVGAVEVGSSVSVSARVFPSSAQGLVELFDGSQSVGLAPVSGGVAQFDVTGLAEGSHGLTARYLGDLVNPASVSEPVEVVVRDVILCRSQAVGGNGAVVRSTYLNLLGRCAEPLGFSYWSSQLDGGLSPEVFARQVASSLEAHGRSVDDGYQLVLGRPADAGGRGFWAQRLNGGQRYDLLLGDLAASGEFWSAAGSTNTGYVTRLYDRLLRRAPDTAGLNYWVGRLNAGQSRQSVAAAFVRLPEPSGQIVADAYRAILDRAPTGEEKTPAVTGFQGHGHRWRIYSALIGTEEFFDHSQTFPNPG